MINNTMSSKKKKRLELKVLGVFKKHKNKSFNYNQLSKMVEIKDYTDKKKNKSDFKKIVQYK